MAIGSATSTNKMRLSGLSGSGLDTDTMVQNLMKAERVKYDRIGQKRQVVLWKQDAYRDMTSLMRGLKDDFLNITKPANNLLSQNTFAKFTGSTSDAAYVNVAGTAEAMAGSHSVHVTQLAVAAQAASQAGMSKPLQGNAVSGYNLSGNTITMTLDGVTRTLSLDNYTVSSDGGTPPTYTSDIVSKAGTGLQALVDNAFGSGKVQVSYNSATQGLGFTTQNGASRLSLDGGSNNTLTNLGFAAGATNRISTSSSLGAINSQLQNGLGLVNGALAFSINGTNFSFSSTDSLSKVISTVNASATAGVVMAYDEASDKITMTARQSGAGASIQVANKTGTFFGVTGATKIDTITPITTLGKDAKVTIDGTELARASNAFTYNGVKYTLNKAHANVGDTTNVTLTQDTDSVVASVKAFVEKYNALVDKINGKLGEKYDRNYQPLTDEQKTSMKEDDIKKWEEKAKTGLLRNDPILTKALNEMRRIFSDSVEGAGISATAVGITTGTYLDKGKLTLDETKLRTALTNTPDAVNRLFTNTSDVAFSDTLTQSQTDERYRENGLAQRLADVIDKQIKTTGVKGALLLQAGIVGDRTQYNSILSKQVDDYDTAMYNMSRKLQTKETNYYTKFANLEKALSKLNSQGSWLSSQLGGK